MNRFFALALLLLGACQTQPANPGTQPTPAPSATTKPSTTPAASATPCGQGCTVTDATIHIDQATPAKACAGDSLSFSFSNLKNAVGGAGVDQIKIQLAKAPATAPAGEKGSPPNLGSGSVPIAYFTIDAAGKAAGNVKLLSSYGPADNGDNFTLKAGEKLQLWATLGGTAQALPIELCPAS
ncbi:MAG: hypothetical protein ACAI44_39895 [Candidatus Sericytochromatia bacterium]